MTYCVDITVSNLNDSPYALANKDQQGRIDDDALLCAIKPNHWRIGGRSTDTLPVRIILPKTFANQTNAARDLEETMEEYRVRKRG